MSWCWTVCSWLPAQLDGLVRVRLLSLVCTFTDYMLLTQPQVQYSCQTILFLSEFLPHFHRHRLLRGHLDRPHRKTTISFTRTNSPLPI